MYPLELLDTVTVIVLFKPATKVCPVKETVRCAACWAWTSGSCVNKGSNKTITVRIRRRADQFKPLLLLKGAYPFLECWVLIEQPEQRVRANGIKQASRSNRPVRSYIILGFPKLRKSRYQRASPNEIRSCPIRKKLTRPVNSWLN